MSNQALFGSLRKVLKYYLKYFTLLAKPQIVLADKSEGWSFHKKNKPAKKKDFVRFAREEFI